MLARRERLITTNLARGNHVSRVLLECGAQVRLGRKGRRQEQVREGYWLLVCEGKAVSREEKDKDRLLVVKRTARQRMCFERW
ncbi:hypothetical protein E2C01_092639 [Portunus trituberculatus]|uniref:Uncharacterized protein n=1 Tax=Portunus trituberculatus TaxID=210409 RepID=A0A5B7JWE4_PORTR|nr:hypothetical protein [Portunus trituberculatus]